MTRQIILALLATAALAVAQPGGDEIIKKSIDAQGGAEKIKAVKTLRMTGKAVIGGKVEAQMVYRAKRPSRFRTEVTMQGHLMTEGFDRGLSWISDGTSPQKAPDENAKRAADTADPIGSPLFDYKEKGNTVEFVGKQDVDGQACYRFNVKLKSGSTGTVYVDQKSFLTFKTVIRSGDLEAESRLDDYRFVGNIMLPYSNVVRVKGQEVLRIQYDKAEVNVPMEDSLFSMPAAKK